MATEPCVQTLFTPDDDTTAAFLQFIRGARHSIHVPLGDGPGGGLV